MKKIFLFLCFVGLVGCMPIQRHSSSNSNFGSQDKGEFKDVRLVEKDFFVKDFVFAESTVVIDADGTKEGSEITSDMLLKEAKKLGADDVVNIKIDKIENTELRDDGSVTPKKIQIIKYKAVGLAIKYK